MLETLDSFDGSTTAAERVCAAFDRALAALSQPAPRQERSLVSQAEQAVRRCPSVFSFDRAGFATLPVADREYSAGRFVCRSIEELAGSSRQGGSGQLRLFVLLGQSALTDIGALQASAPPGSLFQVASQFNCLESPGPRLAQVSDYFLDFTQGPRASISAFPATLLRHYAAPGRDGRFTQGDPTPQLNLLHKVAVPPLAEVIGGYLLAGNITDPTAFAAVLKERFTDLEVGLHEQAEVVLGDDWDGPVEGRPHIAQVLTSTLAAGNYSRVDLNDPTWRQICRQLQRAAYLGTLLCAATTGQRRAVLTLIGGGVFGNPFPIIWDSILWACRQTAPQLSNDLTVVLNARDLPLDRAELQRSARATGGELILCTPRGARVDR